MNRNRSPPKPIPTHSNAPPHPTQEDIQDFEYGASVAATGGLVKGFLSGGSGRAGAQKLGVLSEEDGSMEESPAVVDITGEASVPASESVDGGAAEAADEARAIATRAKVCAAKMARLPQLRLRLLCGDFSDVTRKPRHQRAFEVITIASHVAYLMASRRVNQLLRCAPCPSALNEISPTLPSPPNPHPPPPNPHPPPPNPHQSRRPPVCRSVCTQLPPNSIHPPHPSPHLTPIITVPCSPTAACVVETAKFLVEVRKQNRAEYAQKLIACADALGWQQPDCAAHPDGVGASHFHFKYDEEYAAAHTPQVEAPMAAEPLQLTGPEEALDAEEAADADSRPNDGSGASSAETPAEGIGMLKIAQTEDASVPEGGGERGRRRGRRRRR